MSQKTANGGDAAEDTAADKARIAELEAENKAVAEKLAAAEEQVAALGKQLGAAQAASQEKALADLPERKPSRDFTKDELALAKKLGVPAGYIQAVNTKTGTVVTVDGRKLRAGGDE
ncbi:hypothetical protein [Parvibaculum sp.]|uniref:hypothetical protein n=1 Tax=Parvibaculum sp. TaxID=2024848 RepID=UPI0027339DA0|nr:hypothetical protein [Parvibaculum sp.]MDP3329413.1 hypothetical protein [Parvibaculum sp.]